MKANKIGMLLIAGLLSLMIKDSAFAQYYVGAADNNDWSRGPSCFMPKQAAPEQFINVPCHDSAVRGFYERSVIPNAFVNAGYEQIDRLYEEWSEKDDSFPDGLKKTALICRALDAFFSTDNLAMAEARVRQWQERSGSSFSSLYAEASLWRAKAWQARGSGYASDVSQEGFVLFKERLSKARGVLDKMAKAGKKAPCWYALRLHVALESGESRQILEGIHQEGVEKYPGHQNIDFAMARAYSPIWGGSAKEFDQFVERVVERTSAENGQAMYARLYWVVDSRNELPFVDQRTVQPRWSRLKVGYTDLLKKHPNSTWNRNRFAVLACRANDRETYLRLRAEIANETVEELFDEGLRDACDLRFSAKKMGGIQ